mmetsp:Transcript_43242/g.117048  ORF Transcript_43242/g.117048 Transcript_43242/m.117048 type:complete len:276 (-) Transcript_43242:348-1175(-)
MGWYNAGTLSPSLDLNLSLVLTDLAASTHKRREEVSLVRETEDIAVNQLPAALLLAHLVLLHIHVPREIILEHTHENNREESGEQKHQNERVDDRQPVNLESARKEARIMVAAHAVLPGKLRLGHPLDRVRERDISLHQIVSDIHLALGVGAHVHAHDLVDVVADGEMKVRVKVAPGRLEVTEEQVLTLHLANVAPHRKILKEHLRVHGVWVRTCVSQHLTRSVGPSIGQLVASNDSQTISRRYCPTPRPTLPTLFHPRALPRSSSHPQWHQQSS